MSFDLQTFGPLEYGKKTHALLLSYSHSIKWGEQYLYKPIRFVSSGSYNKKTFFFWALRVPISKALGLGC